MTIPIAAFVLFALVGATMTWRYLERRRSQEPGSERLGLSGRPLMSAQQICQQAASRLKLNVVLVEQTAQGVQAVAGAPWPVHFGILDTMAVGACLESGKPTGIGSGQHGASDWLFIPLRRNGRTIAVAGVAGPYCRRRIDPGEAGIQSLGRNLERFLAARPEAPAEKVAAARSQLPLGKQERVNAA